MKTGIHPKFYTDAKVYCSCGNVFTTGSTVPEIHVEICNKCHPFYTGEQRFVDIEGRIDKFKKKMVIAEKERKKRIEAIKTKIAKQKEKETAPKTLKEMLKSMK